MGDTMKRWPRQKPGRFFALAACLIFVPTLQADGQQRPGDDLLVVDCLLPPQVRQLGRRITYLSARKAIRTTARDCQIRGGEYVAYDRATLSSSLKIWLPLAESGDVDAQTIVGEIYEKGIGGQPDYAMAARWYRMAATQDDVRAQISLGYLFENGLGMDPDPAAAANWYRMAAGSDSAVELDPQVFRIDDLDRHEDSPEMAALRDELETLTAEAEQIRVQLESTRANLVAERTQLQLTESELAKLHAKTQAQAREQQTSQVPAPVSPSLLVLRNDLEQRNQEMAELSALLAETRAELAARTDELGARDTQIAAQAADLARAEERRQELRKLEQDVAASDAEILQQRQKIQVLESSLAASSSDAASGAEELMVMQALLAESEAAAATQRSQMTLLQARLAKSESEAASRETDLALMAAKLQESKSVAASRATSLARVEAELMESKSEVASRENDLARAEVALKESISETASRESELARTKTELQESESVAASRESDLARLEAELNESKAQTASRESDLARTEAELKESESVAASRESDLARAKLEFRESKSEVAARETDMARMKAELQRTEPKVTSREIDLARVEAQLTARESELVAERKKAAELFAELGRLGADARRLQGELVQNRLLQAISERALVGPTIAMIDPEFAGTRGISVVASEQAGIVSVASDVRTRQIIGRVTAPAGLLSLTVNDANLRPNPAGVFTADITLDKLPKSVSVVAIDQQGKREDVAFELRSTLPVVSEADEHSYARKLRSIKFGSYYALIIGNNAYRALPDLQTAVDDARDLERVLNQRYGFQTRLLLNASRYEILSALNDLREDLTTDDNLLIFYAGHGELDRTNMRGHWLPVDAESDSSANWLSNVAITDILNVMNARQILVIADSCYSGALTRSSIAKLVGGMTEAERLNWLQTMVQKRSRMVLSSGGLAPVLDAGGGSHSVFTRALLQVLESNEELIEGQRLYQEVAARVAYQAANMQFDQVPEYAPIRFAGHESGDFFFVPVH